MCHVFVGNDLPIHVDVFEIGVLGKTVVFKIQPALSDKFRASLGLPILEKLFRVDKTFSDLSYSNLLEEYCKFV